MRLGRLSGDVSREQRYWHYVGEMTVISHRALMAYLAAVIWMVASPGCLVLSNDVRPSHGTEQSAVNSSHISPSPMKTERAEFLEQLVARLINRRLTLVAFSKEMEEYNVQVLQPGESYSKELRSDYSRFFPVVEGGRVVGGYFG